MKIVVSPRFLIFSELKSIFFKVRGAPGLLRQVLSDRPDIEYAFIYGSFAAGTEKDKSDIAEWILTEYMNEANL